MALEDFTTYTESDPTADITVTSTKVDVVSIAEEADAQVYSDKGASHFDGDFTWQFEVFMTKDTGGGHNIILGGLSLTNDDVSTDTNKKLGLRLFDNTSNIDMCVHKRDSGGEAQDCLASALSHSTLYYPELERDEAASANGDLIARIYTDSARTSLHDTLTVSLSENLDWQYAYGFMNYGTATGAVGITAFIQNLDLQEGGGPTPATAKSPTLLTLGAG